MSPQKPRSRITMNQTHFPEDVFRLIKSFTKPKPEMWCCDSCAEEYYMKAEKPQYIDGFELSDEPADGFVPICELCMIQRHCAMCQELACVWLDCEECDETYCEDCFDGFVRKCPDCADKSSGEYCQACEGECQADEMEYCDCCGVGKRNGCEMNPSDESIFDGMCDECREEDE